MVDPPRIVITTKDKEHNRPDLVVINEVLKYWSKGLLSALDYPMW